MSTKKQSIEDVYNFCNNINLKCISAEYINSKSKLEFECNSCESIFSKSFIELKRYNKNICHKCNRKNNDEQLKLDGFKKVLVRCEELGLNCLSTDYVSNHENMLFECTSCKQPFERCWSVLKNTDSTVCRSCLAKDIVTEWKYTYEQVFNIFKDNGCQLISTIYVDNKTPLEYICECGNISSIRLSNFLKGQRCSICRTIKVANSKRASLDDVRKIFEEQDCILLSDEFKNSNEKLDYICSCGTKSSIKLSHFKNGSRCRNCSGTLSPTIEEVRDYFENHDCILLSDRYINSKTKLNFICPCGNKHSMTWLKYRMSPYKKCKKCADKLNGLRIQGINHPSYNPNISEEDRLDRRLSHKNKVWRAEVYKRDNYSCKCCNQKKVELNAHHLDGYNWCKEKRHDVDNGITLCIECHVLFHKNYGYGNNTREQFEEFLIKYKNKDFNINIKESIAT